MAKRPTGSEFDIGELYRRYYPMVARRVRQFVAQQDVEELAHEIFLRALEQGDGFRNESQPGTWLYRLSTNYCLNWIRNRKTRATLLDQVGAGAWPHGSASANPEVQAFIRETWRVLDPELATIGVYFYLDGHTQADIAQMLGCSERTINTRLRALETFVRNRENERETKR